MASEKDKKPPSIDAAARQKLERLALKVLAEREGLGDPLVVGFERDVGSDKAELFKITVVSKGDLNGPHASLVLNAAGDEIAPARLATLRVFGPPVFPIPDTPPLPRPLKPITIDPLLNELTLRECETFDEIITVTVPKQPAAKADVYFLADTTGSMGSIIAAVKAGAATILNAPAWAGRDIQFGVGNYKDFPFDPYAFQHQLSPTANTALVAAAINTWSASGGNDEAEGQLFALHKLATDPGIGWRPNAERILVWFGDAPGHDPVCAAISGGPNLTLASVQAELQAAKITVLAISTVTGVAGVLDANPAGISTDYSGTCPIGGGPNQATTLAGATGGQHVTGINPANIVTTIVALIDAAVSTINNLSLVPTGATAPFVTSISPAGGYGPLKGDQEHVLKFRVRFTGVVPCRDEAQIFVGALEVVADSITVAVKRVVITVAACLYHYSVKFICGTQRPKECQDEPVRPGIYATEINIHNPHGCAVEVKKRVIPLVLKGKAIGREPRWSLPRGKDHILLPPDAATMDDCQRIGELLFDQPQCSLGLTIGFLIIDSDRALEVTAVYTASDLEGRLVTLDVETIVGRHH